MNRADLEALGLGSYGPLEIQDGEACYHVTWR